MADSELRYRLRPNQRLQHSWEYRRIRQEGKRLTAGCLVLNWLEREDEGPPRVGIVVSRRIGNAVRRNRARRLLRETFRLCQHHIKRGTDLVLIARSGIDKLRQSEVQRAFLQAIQAAGLLRAPETEADRSGGSA